jgi:exonuclease III
MVKIITLNINGIKTNTKKEFLNTFISQNKPDILALQETNINEFRTLHVDYNIIINNNTENYRSGTIIVYKKNLEMISTEKAEDGRIIRAKFKDFIIVNIYAPTQNEKAENRHLFFLHTLPKFLKASDQNLIL